LSPRLKKLAGFTVFLPALVLYFFGAAALGELAPDVQILKAGYFLVAGVAWALPAKYLMQWMEGAPRKTRPQGLSEG
jgi:hypothetical protein